MIDRGADKEVGKTALIRRLALNIWREYGDGEDDNFEGAYLLLLRRVLIIPADDGRPADEKRGLGSFPVIQRRV